VISPGSGGLSGTGSGKSSIARYTISRSAATLRSDDSVRYECGQEKSEKTVTRGAANVREGGGWRKETGQPPVTSMSLRTERGSRPSASSVSSRV
jgi:hypothetical protein